MRVFNVHSRAFGFGCSMYDSDLWNAGSILKTGEFKKQKEKKRGSNPMHSPLGRRWFFTSLALVTIFLGFTNTVKDIVFMDYYGTVINHVLAFPFLVQDYVVRCRGVVQMTLHKMISCLCKLNVRSQPHPFFEHRPHFCFLQRFELCCPRRTQYGTTRTTTRLCPHLNRGSPHHTSKFPVWLLVLCMVTVRSWLVLRRIILRPIALLNSRE